VDEAVDERLDDRHPGEMLVLRGDEVPARVGRSVDEIM